MDPRMGNQMGRAPRPGAAGVRNRMSGAGYSRITRREHPVIGFQVASLHSILVLSAIPYLPPWIEVLCFMAAVAHRVKVTRISHMST